MKFNFGFFAALALVALPSAGVAQFLDTFSTLDPAWVPDRYDPAGFASVVFAGDSRLRLTLDVTGATASRATQFSSPFYSVQGRQRLVTLAGLWTMSGQVFVSSAFNTTTGALARCELWGHTGLTAGGGDYAILGFTNASPGDELNPNASDRRFRFHAYDGNTGNWIDLGVPAGFAFDAWHTLSCSSTGTAFEYRIDGVLLLTKPTPAGDDLFSMAIEGYNFSQAGSYSVYWDNVAAGVRTLPTITNQPLTPAGTVGTPFRFAITASGAPTSYAATPLPSGLSIDAATGVITGIPTAIGTTSVLLAATNTSGTDFAALTITIAPPGAVPIITNNPLTGAGTVGTPFGFAITASGLPTIYTASPLPAGLVCNPATGVISGTPTSPGTTAALLSAVNATGTGTATLTITVASAGIAPIIANTPLSAPGTVGTPFGFTIQASGSPTSYTASPLPAGLFCNPNTGVISGSPTSVGVTVVLLGATNASGTGNATLAITIAAAGVVPIINNSPLTAAGTVGVPFGFTITAAGGAATYAANPLPAGLGIATATGVISGVPAVAGTTSVLLSATNVTGSSFAALTITIAVPGIAPIITNNPLTGAGTVGTPFGFAITASGLPTSYTASPLPGGLVCNASTGVITGIPTAAGTTATLLSATNATGSGTATLLIAVAPLSIPPSISVQPVSQTVANGGSVTFSANAVGVLPLTFQWYRNGVFIAGATQATLSIMAVQVSDAGSYTARITNAGGTTTTNAATLTVLSSRIVNFSVRAQAGSGSQTLTLGCVVAGNNKTLLVRGIGPGLSMFGVTNPLVDPQLTLYSGNNPIAANDDWQSGSMAAATLAATAQVGAFPLAPGSQDSALTATVNSGAYTAQIVGANNGTGNALAEIYDADSNLAARLINASARTEIASTDGTVTPLIVGFVIAGNGPKVVLIRGIGPGLAPFGVSGTLPDPQLAVFSGSTQIGANDNWETGANSTQIVAASAQVGAFPLAAGSKDAALLVTLQPGNYTVQVSGVGIPTGVALIEVYDIP